MKLLFIGDIFGRPGREVVRDVLPKIKRDNNIDFVIANCENAAAGRGITEKTTKQLFLFGIDAMTSGNHLWDKKESYEYIKAEQRIVRPANFPENAIGNVINKVEINGLKLGIFTLCGQGYMDTVHSPFYTADKLLTETEDCDLVFVDFHAESTAEKRTLGFYLDGKVTAVCGTHTHIQTADEEILPNGTAYITDVGMTGPHDSVIGVKKEIILAKMKSGMPARYEVAESGCQLNAVIITIDEKLKKAIEIKRIRQAYDKGIKS